MHIFSSTFTLIFSALINLTGDWFWALILLVSGIKLLLFPLSIKQQRAQLMTIKLNEAKSILSKKLSNNTEKINSELIKIAAKYHVNPLFSFVPLLIQAPIFLSLYFSILNLGTSVGSFLFPWISSLHSMDNLHILPVIAGLFQGLGGLSAGNKNMLIFVIPILTGVVFLWKAPVVLSAYWTINSVARFIEMRIFSLQVFKAKFFNLPSAEEMIRS